MEFLLFLFIDSILFCISRYIKIYEQFFNKRFLEENGASSWLLEDFEIQYDKSEST